MKKATKSGLEERKRYYVIVHYELYAIILIFKILITLKINCMFLF